MSGLPVSDTILEANIATALSDAFRLLSDATQVKARAKTVYYTSAANATKFTSRA